MSITPLPRDDTEPAFLTDFFIYAIVTKGSERNEVAFPTP